MYRLFLLWGSTSASLCFGFVFLGFVCVSPPFVFLVGGHPSPSMAASMAAIPKCRLAGYERVGSICSGCFISSRSSAQPRTPWRPMTLRVFPNGETKLNLQSHRRSTCSAGHGCSSMLWTSESLRACSPGPFVRARLVCFLRSEAS